MQKNQLNKNLTEDTLELIIDRLVTPPHSEQKFSDNINSIYALHMRQSENVNIATNELFQALLSSLYLTLYLTYSKYGYPPSIYNSKNFIAIIQTIMSSGNIILTDDNINILSSHQFPTLILEQYVLFKNVFSERRHPVMRLEYYKLDKVKTNPFTINSFLFTFLFFDRQRHFLNYFIYCLVLFGFVWF